MATSYGAIVCGESGVACGAVGAVKELEQVVLKGPWINAVLRVKFQSQTKLVFVEGVVSDQDFEDCRCELHQPVEHDVIGGVGCAAESVGFHKAVQALYIVGGPVRYCHAEPAARRNDNVLAGMMLKGGGSKFAFQSKDLPVAVKRLSGKTNYQYEAFGAFFCYLGGVRHEYRMRVARIMGPKPLVVDVIRAVCVVGRCVMQRVKLKCVGEKMFHLEPDGSERVTNGGVLLVQKLLVAVVQYGDDIRIGAGSEVTADAVPWQEGDDSDGGGQLVTVGDTSLSFKTEYAELKALVSNRGYDLKTLKVVLEDLEKSKTVVEPLEKWDFDSDVDYGFPITLYRWEESSFSGYDFSKAELLQRWLRGKQCDIYGDLADLQLVMLTPVEQHGFAVGARERFKVLGMLGDSLFKLWAVVTSYGRRYTAAETAGAVAAVSNKRMRAMTVVDSELVKITEGRFANNDKWYGDFIEAVVGVVFVHCGHSQAMLLAEKLVVSIERK